MCRYVALNKGIIEVRKDESRPTSAEGSSSGEFVQRALDLTTQDGLAGYWAQLAQMSVDYRCACLLGLSGLSVCLSGLSVMLQHSWHGGQVSPAGIAAACPLRLTDHGETALVGCLWNCISCFDTSCKTLQIGLLRVTC